MKGKRIDELLIGESASSMKRIITNDVEVFARITGDFNPVHMNEEFAKSTMFQHRIAHGMLSGSLFSSVLGT